MGWRVLRRARTAAGLPGRLVAVEDRCSAIETHVAATLDAMRSDLVELRQLVEAQLDADADATVLIGNLLRASEHRLEALEERVVRELDLPAPPRLREGEHAV